MPLPEGSGAPAPGAAPEPAPTPAAPLVARVLGTRVLRLGARGTDVRELQRVLRKRGLKVTIDGSFGPRTRRAVVALQRRFRQRASGVVGPALYTKLGIVFRSARSGPAPTAPVASGGDYPLAGPNAANARYLKVFPVAGKHTYFNDWGAPRPQGSHQGNDIMAARGVPVRAVANGRIKRLTRVETGLGGIYIWLADTRGHEYYYAHLTTIAAGLEAGSAVTAGQVIATVGNTGDARYGAPHLHFEVHPAGGAAVNPYTDLIAVDPEPPVR